MVRNYDENVYSSRSFGTLITQVERDFLRRVLERFPKPSQINYLDFACGSGRVVTFMEDFVGHARGIDVAEPMLEIARQKARKAELVCRDITDPAAAVEDRYDLITSFRLFLNAEPGLRAAAMRAASARLKDESSRFVFNNHAILPSYKLLSWGATHARSLVTGKPPTMGTLTHRMVKKLVSDAGMEIEETFDYDVLSGKALPLLGYDRQLRIERGLAGSALARYIGGERLYVVRRRSGAVPS